MCHKLRFEPKRNSIAIPKLGGVANRFHVLWHPEQRVFATRGGGAFFIYQIQSFEIIGNFQGAKDWTCWKCLDGVFCFHDLDIAKLNPKVNNITRVVDQCHDCQEFLVRTTLIRRSTCCVGKPQFRGRHVFWWIVFLFCMMMKWICKSFPWIG